MVLLSLVAGAFAVGMYWDHSPGAPALPFLAPAAPAKKQQSCADDCEQVALVQHLPEADMRACKVRCGDPQAVPAPHEVPRSISVAPADHRGGLAPLPGHRITRTR